VSADLLTTGQHDWQPCLTTFDLAVDSIVVQAAHRYSNRKHRYSYDGRSPNGGSTTGHRGGANAWSAGGGQELNAVWNDMRLSQLLNAASIRSGSFSEVALCSPRVRRTLGNRRLRKSVS
jgi:hypothetical protein